MPDPYVSFPGTAGNYISTDDVNLLDADTAHLHQSIGTWDVSLVNFDTFALAQIVAPVFGSSHGKARWTGLAEGQLRSIGGGDVSLYYPVSGGGSYAASIAVAAAGSTEAQITIQFFDEGLQLRNTLSGVWTDLTGAFQTLEVSGVADALATRCRINVFIRNADGSSTGDPSDVYWDAACLREGSDPSFVPSLRIVNDLDLRVKAALADWDSNNGLLFTWNGSTSGYSFESGAQGFYFRYGNGSADRGHWLTPTSTLVDDTAYEIRSTWDVAGQESELFIDSTSEDTRGGLAAGAGDPSSLALHVGRAAHYGGVFLTGNVYSAEVRDGIGGPVVAKFDARDLGGVL